MGLPGPNMAVPAGAITIAAGREASAKSLYTDWMAAMVTRGTLPGCWQGTPRAVIILASEDSFEYTIKPRLMAAGADLDLVYRLEVRKISSGRTSP